MAFETTRRRVTVRWTAPSDGDAAEAVAETETWLAAQTGRDADWEGVLSNLRETLLRAGLAPLLMGDPEARDMLLGLAGAEDPAALAAATAALAGRVETLLARRERAQLAGPRPAAQLAAEAARPGASRARFRI